MSYDVDDVARAMAMSGLAVVAVVKILVFPILQCMLWGCSQSQWLCPDCQLWLLFRILLEMSSPSMHVEMFAACTGLLIIKGRP